MGEDPEREGLRETPARVARMYEEVFAGLEQDLSLIHIFQRARIGRSLPCRERYNSETEKS